MKRPDIAVVVTTYNQEMYIGQCIEGILAQETTAKVTIYVHDDYSSDGTISVIENFASKYHGKIVPVLSNFNKLSNRKSPILDMVRQIEEEFIAFCNGDDYWIDPNKLEHQLELLVKEPDAGMVHTAFKVLNEASQFSTPQSEAPHLRVARSRLKNAHDFVIGCQAKESSVMIRRSKIDFEFLKGADHLRASDWVLYLSISLSGRILFLNEETLVHRYTKKGVWNAAEFEFREQMKDEVRWYAASNCPDDVLKQEFRKRVTQDFILSNIKKNSFLRLLLKITAPARHPVRSSKRLARLFK
jgi:glycosyltransferase involved in cell wall biosynthesis